MSRSTAVSASVTNERSGFRVVTGFCRKWRSAISSAASHQASAASTQPRSSASGPRRSEALHSGPYSRPAAPEARHDRILDPSGSQSGSRATSKPTHSPKISISPRVPIAAPSGGR